MTVTISHDHLPVYRVVRRGWADPIDTSFSQRHNVDNRWNTPDFPALYCCCSKSVARAIVKDRFGITGVEMADLQETAYPQLIEVHWVGRPVDMITEATIISAGFSCGYPTGAMHAETRRAAIKWHAEGQAGILCRSASVAQSGFTRWIGDHADWSELVIYTQNSPLRPSD
jgi:RES domain-containing protein